MPRKFQIELLSRRNRSMVYTTLYGKDIGFVWWNIKNNKQILNAF